MAILPLSVNSPLRERTVSGKSFRDHSTLLTGAFFTPRKAITPTCMIVMQKPWFSTWLFNKCLLILLLLLWFWWYLEFHVHFRATFRCIWLSFFLLILLSYVMLGSSTCWCWLCFSAWQSSVTEYRGCACSFASSWLHDYLVVLQLCSCMVFIVDASGQAMFLNSVYLWCSC